MNICTRESLTGIVKKLLEIQCGQMTWSVDITVFDRTGKCAAVFYEGDGHQPEWIADIRKDDLVREFGSLLCSLPGVKSSFPEHRRLLLISMNRGERNICVYVVRGHKVMMHLMKIMHWALFCLVFPLRKLLKSLIGRMVSAHLGYCHWPNLYVRFTEISLAMKTFTMMPLLN